MLVNLWATWCTLCGREMPELDRLRPRLLDRGIEVVGLSLDRMGTKGIKEYLKAHNITYPIYVAGDDTVAQIYETPEVWLPLSILLDEKGVVTEIFIGPSHKVLGKIERLASR